MSNNVDCYGFGVGLKGRTVSFVKLVDCGNLKTRLVYWCTFLYERCTDCTFTLINSSFYPFKLKFTLGKLINYNIDSITGDLA